MKFYKQVKEYSCGAAAFRNLLALYHQNYKESTFRKICKTNQKFGTSENGIVNACKELGFECEEYALYTKKKGNNAYNYVKRQLKKEYKIIMCVDNFSHWILCIGMRKGNPIVVDSAFDDTVIRYYTKEDFLARWWSVGIKNDKSQFYAIAVKVK